MDFQPVDPALSGPRGPDRFRVVLQVRPQATTLKVSGPTGVRESRAPVRWGESWALKRFFLDLLAEERHRHVFFKGASFRKAIELSRETLASNGDGVAE